MRQAVLVEDALDALPPGVEIAGTEIAQRPDQLLPVRSNLALGRHHLVV